ncbi:MAG: ankyrin repeat domain-containing protein [Elusimicrobiaceae bacterium]|nr:ankyrin repeat domain-containing protein [Elusimicrobiaceae bacterium]
MKKYLILVLIVVVCWMGFSYHKHMRILRGEELVTDAYYGDLLSVKNDVEQGAPVGYRFTFDDDERQYVNQTFDALHAAASSGNEDVILFLLDQGLLIDSRTSEGWTPLFVAARDGQAEAAKLLVFKGADLNAQTKLGATALMMAVTQEYPTEKARLNLIEYMLKRGADANLTDKYGHSALYYAQMQHNNPVVELLHQYQNTK